MAFDIYRNEVLAGLLNKIDPKILRGQSNNAIGGILKEIIFKQVALEKRLDYVSKEELKKIRSELSGRNNEQIREKSSAQILIAAIINSDYQKIIDAIRKDSELKRLVNKELFSEIQSAIAKNKRPNQLTLTAKEIYKTNPKITAKELTRKLQVGEFDGFEYDELEDAFIVNGCKREIKSSGIKDILSRIKKECS
jgi:hypothetical protein